MAKEFNLEFFIIPNSASEFSAIPDHAKPWYTEPVADFGIELKDDDKMVEIWITGEGEDNISAHGWPDHLRDALGIPEKRHYLRTLPAWVLKELREGDYLTLTAKNGNTIHLTAAQEKYRYRRFGSFEEVYNMVTL